MIKATALILKWIGCGFSFILLRNELFMIEHTFFSPGRFEREANEFAWQLLFDEESCRSDYDGDLGRYAREEGIVELVGYRKI